MFWSELIMCCLWRYMSKHRPAVVLETKSNKDAMRTMGPAKVEVPSPDKYLKKHSKEPKVPESESIFTLLDQSPICICVIYLYIHISFQRRSVLRSYVTPALRRNPLFLPGRTCHPWAFTPRGTLLGQLQLCQWNQNPPVWTPARDTSRSLRIQDLSPSTSRKRLLLFFSSISHIRKSFRL